MHLKVLTLLLVLAAAPLFAAEPPPTCEDSRDQWQIRYQLSQETLSNREASLAAAATMINKLQKELDALKKPGETKADGK